MGVRVCEGRGNTGIVAGGFNIRLFSKLKLTANVWEYLEVSWVGLPWRGGGGGGLLCLVKGYQKGLLC